jgi:flavin reductase (DIM6/NTAB) family NADH-FMN oxidoreductase RutF
MEIPDAPHAHLVGSDGPGEADREVYRGLAADIASGVAVVAARHRGHDVAATVTGYLDVSHDPPTLLVSLYEEGRACEAVEAAGAWTLSLLARDQRGIASWLASPGNPVVGLLNQVPFLRAPVSGAAVVEGALAWFEVRTVRAVTVATHRLVVGEVVAMGRGAGAGDDPLVHFARDYTGLRRQG